MEGFWHRATAVAAIALLTIAVLVSPARAERRDVDATTNGDGVDVLFTHHEDGTVTGHSRAGTSSCTWSATLVDPLQIADPQMAPPQPNDDAQLYALYCDDEYRGLAWLGPRQFTNAPTQPLTEELLRRVQIMPAAVNVRPDSRGVTGIPSLFWVEGYDGAPIQQSVSAFGVTVAVTATLTDVAWDFGDGTPVVHGSLGEAWPQRSSVQHNYVNPSTGPGYHVTVRLTFQPTFTVNGSGGGPLAPIVLTFVRDYVVNEVQAVRNA